jgi:hypothetical protein
MKSNDKSLLASWLAWSIVHSTGRTRKSVRPSSRSNKKQKKRSWPAVSSDDDGRIRGVRSDRADKILLCVCDCCGQRARHTRQLAHYYVTGQQQQPAAASSSQQLVAQRWRMPTRRKRLEKKIPSLYEPPTIYRRRKVSTEYILYTWADYIPDCMRSWWWVLSQSVRMPLGAEIPAATRHSIRHGEMDREIDTQTPERCV